MVSPKKSKIDPIKVRLYFVIAGLTFLFVLVELKLVYIQLIKHKEYKLLGEDQYFSSSKIPARRGNIFSSDGYLLAGTKAQYVMFCDPTLIQNKAEMAQLFADTLVSVRGGDTLEIYAKFLQVVKQDLRWVVLDRNISEVEKSAFTQLNVLGLGFDEIPTRYYPEGTLSAHVLGFVGQDENGEKKGYFGVEGALDQELSGVPGKTFEERDASGNPILIGSFKQIPATQGRDITLTINRSVQFLLENKLKEGVEKYNSASGSALLMDPFTGEIIAMANYPTFSPEKYFEDDEITEENVDRKKTSKKNAAISVVYEPGSVIKPLTVSSAINLKLVTPETTFEDFGPVNYSGHYIDNWDKRHHQVQTIIELLQKSNNIGAAWVGTKVGAKNMYHYFTEFGVGQLTHLELEGEETGTMRNYDDWTAIDLANVSFGQGISATPLQVVSAFNVLANGGFYVEPRIIQKIKDNDKEFKLPSKNSRRVLTKETSDTMITLLEKAVEGGEAKYFVLKDYKVAGKTGTAQIFEDGKYSPDKTNATFVGFLSGEKKLALIVKLEEPLKSPYAAETAVPLWMEMITDLVKFYGIPPDKIQNQ